MIFDWNDTLGNDYQNIHACVCMTGGGVVRWRDGVDLKSDQTCFRFFFFLQQLMQIKQLDIFPTAFFFRGWVERWLLPTWTPVVIKNWKILAKAKVYVTNST